MRAHIVGGGIAGLSCAARLARDGVPVTLYEAAPAPGGRCRTFDAGTPGRTVDSGIHLLLSQNRAAFAYLDDIDAAATLARPARPGMEFVDVRDGVRWRLRPAPGPIPWWTLVPGRTVPGSGLRDWLALARIRFAAPEATVGDYLPRGRTSIRRLWEPSVVAALNMTSSQASAQAYWAGIRESIGGGAAASRIAHAREGLSRTFVDPALGLLTRNGADVRATARLRALTIEDGRVAALVFDNAQVPVGPFDRVVLAVPPGDAARLLPGLAVPTGDSAIVTIVYHTDRPLWSSPDEALFALVDDRTVWVLVRAQHIVATIGAADGLVDRDRESLAQEVWRQVAFGLRRPAQPMPGWDLIATAHGTFAQTPANMARRPGARTHLSNLLLAGDWTDTGYPASIESAVRSGHRAAALARGAADSRS